MFNYLRRYILVKILNLTEQYEILESKTLQAQDLVQGLRKLLDAADTQLNHIEAKVEAIGNARRNQLPERLLRLPEVQSMTGLNRNAVYEIEDFPRPVKISARCSAWVHSEVQDWIQNQIEQQRSGEKND